jgi:hypothetical protein
MKINPDTQIDDGLRNHIKLTVGMHTKLASQCHSPHGGSGSPQPDPMVSSGVKYSVNYRGNRADVDRFSEIFRP